MTWRTVVAMLALLSACPEIGAAAARGRYSNFGPWSSNQSQVVPHDIRNTATPRTRKATKRPPPANTRGRLR